MTSFPNRYFEIQEPATLLNFLFSALQGQSKTTVKSLLAHRQISVNGQVTTQFDKSLQTGDQIRICTDRKHLPFHHPLLEIIYEDDYFIVVHKKSGLLSIANDKTKEKTAYHLLNEYVKQKNTRSHVFILHRLDRDTSGIMMFTKNQRLQKELQSDWGNAILERKYVAIAEGTPAPSAGTLRSFLSEDENHFVHSSPIAGGKIAITHYKTLKTNKQYSLIELELETGRKNQIRVHLQSIGHPVTGDKKYGAHHNPLHRLALHAFKLRFIHPVTKQEMNFETPVPAAFTRLLKNGATT